MSDLAGGNGNSGKKKRFIPRGRGRGHGSGGAFGNVPHGNPPSYNDAMSYTGQNVNYGSCLMPQNPPMSSNQMYGGGAPNFGYMQGIPSLTTLLENPNLRQPYYPPPSQQVQQQVQQQYQQGQQQYQQNRQGQKQYQQNWQGQKQYQQNRQGQKQYQQNRRGQQFQQKGQQSNQPFKKPYDLSQNKPSSLTAKDIICELVTFSGFWSELDTLSKRVHRDSNETRTVLNNYKGIFNTKNDDSTSKLLVELSPKIKFCQEYMEETGCHKDRCFAIHTCQYNLFGSCAEKACPFGHNLRTNHNCHIFKNFELDDVGTNKLKDLLKIILKGSVYPKICSSYHLQWPCKYGKGCKQLHICYDYVFSLGNCSNGDDCVLNHNIHDPGCTEIFNRFGISTNESPRDLLKLIVTHMQQSDDDNQWEDTNDSDDSDDVNAMLQNIHLSKKKNEDDDCCLQ